MLLVYRFIVGLLFWISFPILYTVVTLTGRHRRGLMERLGIYDASSQADTLHVETRFWIHAASIGEVRAAGVLIDILKRHEPKSGFWVTTMTIHGRDFARQHLGPEVVCYLAPLDVPYAVNRALAVFKPHLYVCLETELWPVLIDTLKTKQIPSVLVNGRLSARSSGSYRRFKFLFAPVLQCFRSIAAISEVDRKRFIEVGADPDLVAVTGNIKDDTRLPDHPERTAALWAERLEAGPETDVFIAGSTHAPEEELLLPLIRDLSSRGAIAAIAPRHLDRLPDIEALLSKREISYDRLSDIKAGGQRSHSLILVDTFGDLGELYSVATFVFVGGSLSGSGGHNVMEPAIWERPVFFGPDMADFADAAATLEKCGGGFRVDDIDQLGQEISGLQDDRDRLQRAGRLAGKAARDQRGAAEQQALLIRRSLEPADKTLNI